MTGWDGRPFVAAAIPSTQTKQGGWWGITVEVRKALLRRSESHRRAEKEWSDQLILRTRKSRQRRF